jgi:predicted GNAT family acetyltransferase
MSDVTDDGSSRFEMPIDGETAFVSYRRADGVLALLHAEVPPQFEGRGVGARLVKGVLDLARAKGEKVIPYCSFVAAYIRRHPEYRDLLAD